MAEQDQQKKKTIPPLHIAAFIAVMLLALVFSAYFRFNGPTANQPTEDEFYSMVPAVKLNVDHPKYDPRLFNFHHPFFGFKLMGALLDSGKEYTNSINIPANLLYWAYLAAPELRPEEVGMRSMLALFGVLLFIPVFLIGRELYGNLAGILAAAITGISIGFINLSRVLIQDGFLPFFMFMAMYCGIKYLKAKPSEKFFFADSSLVFLLTSLVFLYLSFIIRIGQPALIFLALLIAVFMKKEKKYGWVFFYAVPLMAILVIISFGIEPINQLLLLRGTNIVPFTINTGFFPTLFSLGSLSFIALLAYAACSFGMQFAPRSQKKIFGQALSMREIRDKFNLASTSDAQHYIESNYEHRKEVDGYILLEKKHPSTWSKVSGFFLGLESEKKFLLLSFIGIMLAVLFTETGSIPRIYMFSFVLPIIFLSGKATASAKPLHYAGICCLVLLDLGMLFSANPHFNGYTVLGLAPKYMANFSAQYAQVYSTLSENGNPKIITNEPGLLLRYENSEPLPPNYEGFRESNNCNPLYFASQAGNLLVYRAIEYDLNANDYICPAAAGANLVKIRYIGDENGGKMFQIYKFA